MKLRFSRLTWRYVLVVVMLAPNAVSAAESPKQAPQIVPKEQELLKQVCATMSATKNFEFHAEVTFDQVLPTRAKLQFAGAIEMARELPNRLMVNFASDLGSKRFWYDGETVTLLDGAHRVYGTMAVESSIGGMLTEIADRGNFTVPLSDLAVSDPCALLQSVKNGIYVGIGDVDGTPTDHLAFAGKGATFQIWLERGARPLPRKIVITHTNVPESPQFTAIFTDWRFPKEIPESMFTPEIPKGFIRADFAAAKKAIEPGNPGGGKTK